ncbi:LysR family transcriptional regulator [Knoellia sp. CPCC 206435]|uniref:LysR family transcriptional regulator n=1 Tax=Knoellia terrae TaxID=3404797 RepID=UPI002882A4AF|nr:LysR family transcriptional regulator [Rothia sp. ARF10]
MAITDLRRLRVLRELAERGTLAAVAEATGYSPSAASQQLAVLEKEAGVPLTERAGRGLRLTMAGNLLAEHAAILLDAAEVAETALAESKHETQGRLRAVGLQSATRRLLIPAMVEMRETHPQVRVQIAELELELALPELRLGTVDLVISDEYESSPRPRPAGLEHVPLLRERTRLVLPARHPLAQTTAAVAVATLRDEVWTSSSRGTGHHAMVLNTCRALGGFDPDLRHESNDADIQLELVRAAGAVTLLPDLTLPHDDPELAIRDLAETQLTRNLFVVTRQGRKSRALTAYAGVVIWQSEKQRAATG